ncbi:transmembrane protein, putative [Medicago truncatula]|uniref:Transmembrane protein, putative n=1 Tax=Medicago truncatula TaxID=3880 RepID=G7JNJ2_MEDTR|nr:transmembrane protein, putative [Medicago truncatula]
MGIGSKNSWKLWDHIHAFFQTHANAKWLQLRYELRAMQLDQGSISEVIHISGLSYIILPVFIIILMCLS